MTSNVLYFSPRAAAPVGALVIHRFPAPNSEAKSPDRRVVNLVHVIEDDSLKSSLGFPTCIVEQVPHKDQATEADVNGYWTEAGEVAS